MTTINTPTGGNGEKNTKIQELTGEKKNEVSEALIGNTDAILEDLRKNHVTIEENAEFKRYKGKKVHIELPAIGNFEGFKFDYFISNDKIEKILFGNNSDYEKQSYTMKEIGELLKALNKYMKELRVEKTDRNIDYENDLKSWGGTRSRSMAGYYLKKITGLDKHYWLRDKNVGGKTNSRAGWICSGDDCYFDRYNYDISSANLFLRLSD